MGGCGSKDGVSDTKKKAGGTVFPQASLKSCDELTNFDDFFHKDSNSALKKCLTKEIWEEYKDKSDASGVAFKVMIFSGI
jgi:hypothetical protein